MYCRALAIECDAIRPVANEMKVPCNALPLDHCGKNGPRARPDPRQAQGKGLLRQACKKIRFVPVRDTISQGIVQPIVRLRRWPSISMFASTGSR